jgi:hypothetical protein
MVRSLILRRIPKIIQTFKMHIEHSRTKRNFRLTLISILTGRILTTRWGHRRHSHPMSLWSLISVCFHSLWQMQQLPEQVLFKVQLQRGTCSWTTSSSILINSSLQWQDRHLSTTTNQQVATPPKCWRLAKVWGNVPLTKRQTKGSTSAELSPKAPWKQSNWIKSWTSIFV